LKRRQNVRGLRRGAAGGRAETGSDYTGKPDPGELFSSMGCEGKNPKSLMYLAPAQLILQITHLTPGQNGKMISATCWPQRSV
jgi:hypothetical protein